MGVDESIDPLWQAATWIWDKLPASVQNTLSDAFDKAVEFVLENGGEVLAVTTVAAGILKYKRIGFFDKVTGYFSRLANLAPGRRITAKLSQTKSDSYRSGARRIWKNVTGHLASEDLLGGNKGDANLFSGPFLDLGARFLGSAAGTESVFQSQLLGYIPLPSRAAERPPAQQALLDGGNFRLVLRRGEIKGTQTRLFGTSFAHRELHLRQPAA